VGFVVYFGFLNHGPCAAEAFGEGGITRIERVNTDFFWGSRDEGVFIALLVLFVICERCALRAGHPYDGKAVMRSGIKVDPVSLPAKWSVRRVSVVNDLLFEARAPHGQVNSFSGMSGRSDRRDLTARRLFAYFLAYKK